MTDPSTNLELRLQAQIYELISQLKALSRYSESTGKETKDIILKVDKNRDFLKDLESHLKNTNDRLQKLEEMYSLKQKNVNTIVVTIIGAAATVFVGLLMDGSQAQSFNEDRTYQIKLIKEQNQKIERLTDLIEQQARNPK